MDKFSARRKLLQGTLSAPLVMTVSSAGAAITTFERCYIPANGTAPLAQFTDAPSFWTWTDSAYRIAINAKFQSSNNRRWIQYPNSDNWYLLDSTNPFTAQPTGPINGTPPTSAQDTKYAALVFFNPADPNATPVGYAWQPNGSTTIANKSCYASLFA